jgi:hypothetical protein
VGHGWKHNEKDRVVSKPIKVMGISFSEIMPVFTQMQDDSNLDNPPKKNLHGKMYLSKSKMIPLK